MIAKLYDYFGVLGILSMLVWMTAVVLMGVYARRQRQKYCLLALMVAIAAMLLANANSDRVSAIRLDRRAELAAAQKAQKQQAEASGESGSAAPVLQFAEGDPETAVPEYRKQGKQARTKGKSAAPMTVIQKDEAPDRSERLMGQEDLLAANRLDRINLMIARLLMLVAIGLVFWDYLAWFNTTADTRCALPIGGKWMDHLFHKTHSVLVMSRADLRMIPVKYVERMARKGENFVYFGDHDPWAEQACPRFKFWLWRWSLPKLVFGDAGSPQSGEFVLDAAWFGRYGVVIPRNAEAGSLLMDMVGALLERHDTGASARKTLHIVWDLPELPPMETIAPLIQVARETNIKLAVWSTGPVASGITALFDEQFGPPGVDKIAANEIIVSNEIIVDKTPPDAKD